MLSAYLNQKASLQRFTGNDDWGNPTYSYAEQINCREQTKTAYTLSQQDENKNRYTIYYTDTVLKAGDKLNGDIVKSVDVWALIGGNPLGFKAVI